MAIFSLFLYALSLESVVNGFGFEEKSEHKYLVFIKSIWPVFWLAGTLPVLGLAKLFGQSHAHLNTQRAKTRASIWLGCAFAISALFPLNYIAHDTNIKWDLGYFKTPEPGSSTLTIVETLPTPMTAYLFFSTSSNVRQEVRSYFSKIENPNLSVVFVDWDAEGVPEELRENLKPAELTKGNGYILLYKHTTEEKSEDPDQKKTLTKSHLKNRKQNETHADTCQNLTQLGL